MPNIRLITLSFYGILSLLCTTVQVSAQTITVAWREKPPHQYRENGQDKGILLERSKRVFAESKIPTKFVEEPAKRIWQNFQKKNTQLLFIRLVQNSRTRTASAI